MIRINTVGISSAMRSLIQQDQAVIISASAQPSASVIWLHGLGADGHDFVPVVEMLNLTHMRFILPHAPYQAITINNGYEMRAWYDLYGLTLGSREDDSGIRSTQTFVNQWIAEEQKRGIAANRIVLAGFSQGGAIALHTALRYPQRLAGVLALSTYLPLKPTLAQEKTAANQDVPIFMAHGTYDEVIDLDTCSVSRQTLIDADYAVEWHEYPMAHSVCMEEIDDIRNFLQRICPE